MLHSSGPGVLVSKGSGGEERVTERQAAARAGGFRIVVVQRPPAPACQAVVTTAHAVLDLLSRQWPGYPAPDTVPPSAAPPVDGGASPGQAPGCSAQVSGAAVPAAPPAAIGASTGGQWPRSSSCR